jgi:hypothetical protein
MRTRPVLFQVLAIRAALVQSYFQRRFAGILLDLSGFDSNVYAPRVVTTGSAQKETPADDVPRGKNKGLGAVAFIAEVFVRRGSAKDLLIKTQRMKKIRPPGWRPPVSKPVDSVLKEVADTQELVLP